MSKALNNIDLTAAQRKEVAALLQRYLPDTEVWAYGSRVKFTAKPHSDLDMVAFASKEQSQAVANLREAFEESYLPFRVDLFVWDEVPEGFHRNIEEARVVVQKEKKGCELPEGWQRISFSDAVHLNPTVKLTKGNRYPFVDMKSLNPACREVVPNEMRTFQSGGARFLPKDTLLARITPCLENGKIARYNPIETNREAFGSTEFIVIRGKDGVTDNDFVYYLTIWPEFRKFAISQMTGSSGRQRVPVGSLAGFTFNLPPRPQQKAIAHILGSLDDKIELNRRMNETLEAMAQALFKSWFVDFDPVIDNALAAGNPIPDELKEKACLRRSLGRQAAIRQGLGDEQKSLPDDIRRLFPSEFVYTEEMGWVPKGWEMLSVGEVSSCFDNRRIPLSRKQRERKQPGTIPYYGATSIMDYINEYIFNDIFLLIGEDGSVVKEDGSPFTQYIWGQTWVNNHAHVLQGAFGISTEHLMLFLQSQNIRSYTTGAVQLKINQKNMNSIPFLFAEHRINKSFASIINPLYKRIRKLSESNKKLYKIQDALLPRLLSGEIRAPNFDSAYGEKK